MSQLGSAYVEIDARKDKLEKSLNDVKMTVEKSATEMETKFKNTRLDINDQLANMKLKQLKQLHAALTQQMNKKLELGANDASLNKTVQALEAVKAKMDAIRSGDKGGGSLSSQLFGNLSQETQDLIGRFGKLAIGVMSVEKAFEFMKSSVEAFEGREKAILGVESTIKSMGKESEYTSEELLAMAKNIAAFNKYSVKVSDILDMQSFLMTLDTMNRDLLPKASQLVVDLAAKMKTDLTGAAKSLGIALEDPENGLTRFRRQGIVFTESQKDMIKAMVESGNKAGAQAKIFEVLETKVGDYAKNTTTRLEEFNNRIAYFGKGIEIYVGRSIVEKISPMLELLSTALAPVENKMKSATDAAIKQKVEFDTLSNTYLTLKGIVNKTAAEKELYKQTIDKLNEVYPNYFKNVNLEKDGLDKVTGAIKNAKEMLDSYLQSKVTEILLDSKKAELAQTLARQIELTQQQIDLEKQLKDAQKNGTANETQYAQSQKGGTYSTGETLGQKLTRDIETTKKALKGLEKDYENTFAAISKTQKSISEKFIAPAPVGPPPLTTTLTEDQKKEQEKKHKELLDLKEKNEKAYYDKVRWFDADYNDYLERTLNKEIEDLSSTIKDEIKLQEYKTKRQKEIQQDFWDWVKKNRPELLERQGLVEVEARGLNFRGKQNKQGIYIPDTTMPSFDNEDVRRARGNSENGFTSALKGQKTLADELTDSYRNMGEALTSTWTQNISVFSQANSMLQQFINGLVQATLQAFALKSATAAINFFTQDLLGGIFRGGASAAAPVGSLALPTIGVNAPMNVQNQYSMSTSGIISGLNALKSSMDNVKSSVQALTVEVLKQPTPNTKVFLDSKEIAKSVLAMQNKLNRGGFNVD